MSARLATTILLVRGEDTDLEVFMVQRHRKSGFLPNAWVFPGGRVDEGDRLDGHPGLRGGDEVLRQLQTDRQNAVALVVAGVRETWEEVGVWLGEGPPDPSLRGPLSRGERSLAELLSESSRLHLDRLRAWSWWVTPEAEPRRYDTRFLIARAEDADGRHDDHETVDSRWVRPSEALQWEAAHFPMAPPTWFTLVELARQGNAIDAFASAANRPQRPIQPIMQFADDGLTLQLPGHPDHPDEHQEGLPDTITWEKGLWLGWRAGEPMG